MHNEFAKALADYREARHAASELGRVSFEASVKAQHAAQKRDAAWNDLVKLIKQDAP